jgi:hypothetical protein
MFSCFSNRQEFFIIVFCLVLSHHYGKDGRDTKQIESKGILFDFELFQNMSSTSFTAPIIEKLTQFVRLLNTEHSSKGKNC